MSSRNKKRRIAMSMMLKYLSGHHQNITVYLIIRIHLTANILRKTQMGHSAKCVFMAIRDNPYLRLGTMAKSH